MFNRKPAQEGTKDVGWDIGLQVLCRAENSVVHLSAKAF